MLGGSTESAEFGAAVVLLPEVEAAIALYEIESGFEEAGADLDSPHVDWLLGQLGSDRGVWVDQLEDHRTGGLLGVEQVGGLGPLGGLAEFDVGEDAVLAEFLLDVLFCP